jgi:hypothetical protein
MHPVNFAAELPPEPADELLLEELLLLPLLPHAAANRATMASVAAARTVCLTVASCSRGGFARSGRYPPPPRCG